MMGIKYRHDEDCRSQRAPRHAACVLNRESHKLAKDVGLDLRKSWSSWQSIIDESHQ